MKNPKLNIVSAILQCIKKKQIMSNENYKMAQI